MTFDPNRSIRLSSDDPEEGVALHPLNADVFDAAQMPRVEGVDPVADAQHEAGEAALKLNGKLAGQRTAEEIARVERLSKRSNSLASSANSVIVVQHTRFGETG